MTTYSKLSPMITKMLRMRAAAKKRAAAKAKKRAANKRGGSVGLAKAALSYGVPELIRLVRSGAGSQGGNSAGSKAARMRFGAPVLRRYR